MGRHTASTGRPLIVTADEQLLDRLLTLAGKAGLDVDVVPDAGSARSTWLTASVVLLDDAVAGMPSTSALTRRAGVIVVGRNLDDSQVWRRAVSIGADHVVFLPDADEWLVQQLAHPTHPHPTDTHPTDTVDESRVVTVVTATGGAGASTLAASLALRAVGKQLSPLLVDGDPRGGGIDLLLGAETVPGVRWGDLSEATGRIERQTLVDALPVDDGLPFLSWSRDHRPELGPDVYASVMSSIASAGSLGVVDLGRTTGALAEAALAVTTSIVVLVPSRVRAVAAASQLVQRLDSRRDQLLLVVRRPSPAGLDAESIAKLVDLPLFGTLPHDARRAEWEENGLPPSPRGAWQRVADAILAHDSKAAQAA